MNRIQLKPIFSPIIAITSALIIGAILILIAGANPIAAYTALNIKIAPIIRADVIAIIGENIGFS
ncbi:MAG: hypothetical protein AAFR37_12675 [Cyanobacteria bacterium J06628_3]